MNKKTKFSKFCPKCGIIQYYKSEKLLNRSIKKNTNCYVCSNRRKVIPPKFCADCGVKITNHKETLRCKRCAQIVKMKNPKHIENIRVAMEGRKCSWGDKISKSNILYYQRNPKRTKKYKTLFEIYKLKVRKYTRRNDLSGLQYWNDRGRAGKVGAYHLDHKYSVAEGFRNNVLPQIIGHICNLEYIPWRKNASKVDNCSIGIDELMKLINNYELKFDEYYSENKILV